MRVFSTFTGIGGFEIGIRNAYLKHALVSEESEQEERTQGRGRPTDQQSVQLHDRDGSAPLCVGYSEIDKYAIKVYERHFPNVRNYGDITKINADELPDFDCLVGGFPCQAFSIAGKRRGFEDTRGTLFFDLARILRAKRPRLFVFENVKGLLSHDNGNTFRTIIATIAELGYDCQWQVLNSKNFGVPQNRERVLIVGHLRGVTRPEVFPITTNTESDIVLPTLTARYHGAQANGGYISHEQTEIRQLNDPTNSNDRVYGSDGIAPTLNTMQGGLRQPFVSIPEATKKGYADATVGQAINLSVPNSKTRRGRVSDVAPTLDTGMQLYTLTEDVRIRRLTPVECERLQAFPDNWTKHGNQNGTVIPISDTQRYKMCSNAVTTNVIQAVFEKILTTL